MARDISSRYICLQNARCKYLSTAALYTHRLPSPLVIDKCAACIVSMLPLLQLHCQAYSHPISFSCSVSFLISKYRALLFFLLLLISQKCFPFGIPAVFTVQIDFEIAKLAAIAMDYLTLVSLFFIGTVCNAFLREVYVSTYATSFFGNCCVRTSCGNIEKSLLFKCKTKRVVQLFCIDLYFI